MTLRTLRCPLCCEQYEVSCEADCQAHIANCKAFHAEYGKRSRRGDLVEGLDDLVATPGPARASAATSDNVAAVDRLAWAVLPLVPLQRVAEGGRTVEEALQLVAQLASVLSGAADSAEGAEDFDALDLVQVTFGPLLAQLGERGGAAVEAAVCAALGEARRGALPEDDLVAALTERLRARVGEFRHCDRCGRSGCTLYACTRCRAVRYCGQSCQRGAWTEHKRVCRGVAPDLEPPPER